MIPDSLWVRGATNGLRLIGMHDTTTRPPIYPTYAVVTGSVLDDAGVPLPGANALPMPYIAGTIGEHTEYRADVPAGVAVPLGYITISVQATVDGLTRPYTRRVLVVDP